MHFILEGRIGVLVETEDGRSIRVRSLGPYTTIGEMGLMTKQLRSATIQAEVPSVLYALSAEAYQHLEANNPRAGPSFAHLREQRVGRTAQVRQQGDRRLAPLASRARRETLASDRRNATARLHRAKHGISRRLNSLSQTFSLE